MSNKNELLEKNTEKTEIENSTEVTETSIETEKNLINTNELQEPSKEEKTLTPAVFFLLPISQTMYYQFLHC